MISYQYNHIRAREARLEKICGSTISKLLLLLLTLIAMTGGGMLLMRRMPLGWLLIGAGFVVMLFLIWLHVELSHLPARGDDNINDILSRDCLALLGKDPTPQSIAQIVTKTRSGVFLANRYGITAGFLAAAADGVKDAEEIFSKAMAVREKTQSAQVAGGVLAVALIECNPNHEQALKKMRLELEDLYGGVIWFNYLHGLVKGMKAPRRTGGMGRDLNFGYTPLLQKFAQNISMMREGAARVQIHQAAHGEVIDKMLQVFSGGGRQNVALIGPEGCGRTTVVYAFADKLLDADSKISSKLKFRQIFKLDAAAMVSMANGRGELERLMIQIMNEAYAAKNVILWLDDAQLFFEEGVGSVDISKVIMPVIEAGNLRVILTMEQQRYLEISARNSTLANALNKIMITPANAEETMKIMQDRAPQLEWQHKVIFSYWSLKEAYRLSEKYIHDMQMPGRALNLLEAAAGFADADGIVLAESVQKAVEKTYGVRMQASQDDAERQRLLNLEKLLHQRMIGQDQAVDAVSDALRRAAAGVRNENRPIGTFLFLGPTGVGKTELAKALSEVYFNGESQIVRLDLNEFVEASSVDRLIADGAEDEMSLTAQVMKHPFSVVLLDEIEKAHPKVLTTLLQLLDEGILRDVRNREVSFRDAIVIATSNAGADKIRSYIDAGHDLAALKEDLTNELISSGEFKPEFLNRFDEICVFQPLTKSDLMQIVDLIITSVNKTLETQKIQVTLDDEAKALLVERGYDPKLGARPMRRVVQKTVENFVAKAVLSGAAESGARLTIGAKDIKAELE